METLIKAQLEQVRPYLQADGGDMELVKIVDKTIYLRLKGACSGCPHSQMTVKGGIERFLRDTVDADLIVESV